jgi:hypothetical protein
MTHLGDYALGLVAAGLVMGGLGGLLCLLLASLLVVAVVWPWRKS